MSKFLILISYILLLIGIGIHSSRRIHSTGDFLVAGNRGGVWQITGSLLATILGSSAILGSSDLAFTQGWAAAWWILTGSIGLLFLVLLAPVIKRHGKYTLPQLIADQYGKEAGIIASLVIPVAWIGIVAAQIIGGAKVMTSFFGFSYGWSVVGIGTLFIFYTAIGGQISVIKTDITQSIIIILGIAVIAAYLFFSFPAGGREWTNLHFPFNNGFRSTDLLVLLLTHSTTFLVGPDIYTRLFCARNEIVARKSVLYASLVLIPFAFMITFLGVFAAKHFPDFDFRKGSSLIFLLNRFLPEWGIGLLVAAILSGILSAASTTLLTSSVIVSGTFNKDLDSRTTIVRTRLIMVAIGAMSMALALSVTSIIQSLLIALTFFSGAFVVPVLAGLTGFRNGRIQSNSAMVFGGLLALAGRLIVIHGSVSLGNYTIFSAFLLNGLLLFPGGKWNRNKEKKIFLIKFLQLEHSLILYHNNHQIFTSDEHWLYPLFELEAFLKQTVIPAGELFLRDKIAGKAAAALIVRLGIRDCFIELLSERAIPVFEQYGVKYGYDQLVDHIQCRTEDLITDKMNLEDTYLFLRKRAGKVQGTTLKINSLTVEIEGKKILENLDLELGRGEQLVIQGENGTGKTTLLRSVLGLVKPVHGTILIGEEVVGSQAWKKNRVQTGYLNQETIKNNFPITAGEVVAIGVSGIKIAKVEREYRMELSMRKTGCFHLQHQLYHRLSGGEKQRVSLARCLCQNARLLVLDEPTSYLDEKGKEELREMLVELSSNEAPSMLLVSHDSNWTDKLNWHGLTLKNGRLW